MSVTISVLLYLNSPYIKAQFCNLKKGKETFTVFEFFKLTNLINSHKCTGIISIISQNS